jgi:nucleoside phosphorylase
VSANEDQPTKPAKPKGPDRPDAKPSKTSTPDRVSAVAGAAHDAMLPANVDRLTTAIADPPERSSAAVSVRPAPTQISPIAVPTPPAPSPPNLIGVVSQLVSGVVNAILSPFIATNAPGAPAGAPAMWALLAFVRREFESAVRFLFPGAAPAVPQTTSQTLAAGTGEPEQRTLILSAFPAEADAILARTTLDPNPVVVVDGQHFYLGTLGGKKVIVAMTGIGIVNATQTTETALDHFTPESGISIGAVVFSGVAGGSGRTEIGSVAVPARWTLDGGTTWHAVDPGMLAAANTLNVDLLSADTIGDPACLCSLLGGFLPIDLHREPQLFVGGDGSTSDNNNGTAFPAVPVVGGDIFGPEPYRAPDYSLFFPGNFFQAIVPWLAFGLFTNITGIFTNVPPAVDAADQETAAVQQVADAHGIPFLGVRGMSDGPGDPLNLPGYPFTFFVYKQLAADNSAIVTEGFLQNWAGPDSPPETTM